MGGEITIKETFEFTPVQMEKATQLEQVAQRVHHARGIQRDIGGDPVWQSYTTEEGKLEFYPVTPQVIFGMMICRRALFEEVGCLDTAHSIVEKYLGPNESI